MAKRGRPLKYSPEIGVRVAREMAGGLSLDAAAAACGIAPRTAYNWCQQHQDFLHAIEAGRAASLLFWERRAIDVAEGKAGNSQLISLGLRNRSRSASGWEISPTRVELSGPTGMPVQVQATSTLDTRVLSTEQRQLLRQLLLAAVSGTANKDSG